MAFPTPCTFLSPNLPRCAVVRPTSDALNGPMAVVNFLIQDGLLVGQSGGFFKTLTGLAAAAEAARRQF
jgi:hypothetical protein